MSCPFFSFHIPSTVDFWTVPISKNRYSARHLSFSHIPELLDVSWLDDWHPDDCIPGRVDHPVPVSDPSSSIEPQEIASLFMSFLDFWIILMTISTFTRMALHLQAGGVHPVGQSCGRPKFEDVRPRTSDNRAHVTVVARQLPALSDDSSSDWHPGFLLAKKECRFTSMDTLDDRRCSKLRYLHMFKEINVYVKVLSRIFHCNQLIQDFQL